MYINSCEEITHRINKYSMFKVKNYVVYVSSFVID